MPLIPISEIESWLRWQASFPWLHRWALPVFRAAYEAPVSPWAAVLAVRGIERIEGPAAADPLWLALLRHPDPAFSTQTAHCLREPRFASALIERFTPGIPNELARAILQSLGQSRAPQALPLLIAALDLDDLRPTAIESLGALGQPAAIPHLERFLEDSTTLPATDPHGPPPTIGDIAGSAIARLRKALTSRQPGVGESAEH